MNTNVRKEIRDAAHFAHTLSRLAVNYERMALEFPLQQIRYFNEAVRYRSEGWQWLDHARDLRERYA